MTNFKNSPVVEIGCLVKYRGFQPLMADRVNKDCGIVIAYNEASKTWGYRVLEYEVLWCCGTTTREHYSMLETIKEMEPIVYEL